MATMKCSICEQTWDEPGAPMIAATRAGTPAPAHMTATGGQQQGVRCLGSGQPRIVEFD